MVDLDQDFTLNEKGLESLEVELPPLYGFGPLGFRMERKQTFSKTKSLRAAQDLE